MIDRDHALPITRQASCWASAGARCTTCPGRSARPIWRSCAGSTSCTWSTPSWARACCASNCPAKASQVGRRHIATLMQRMGIEALAPQPGTSKRAPGHKIYPYLLRKLAIARSNQVWALDTTYIPMARGFVYLTAVVDVASRRVLAHKVAITLEACHAREVIEQAFARWGTPEIVNTDQGSQFTADRVHRRGAGQGLPAQHGRARRLARQRVRRAAVAQREVRARVPQGLRQRQRRARRHRRLHGLVQRRRERIRAWTSSRPTSTTSPTCRPWRMAA